jgi:hypothetical protein
MSVMWFSLEVIHGTCHFDYRKKSLRPFEHLPRISQLLHVPYNSSKTIVYGFNSSVIYSNMTDWPQTLHTSPPWSGGGRRVRMYSQYFNFPTFATYSVASERRFVRGRWLPAPHFPPTALVCYITCWCDVTDVMCTVFNAQKTRRSERNACVWKWKPDETGRK